MRSFLDARALLEKYGQRAKKSWGQNFLISERVLDEIVEASVGAEPGKEPVIEIGAGLGSLTDRLAARATRVVAIERDREMVAILRTELADRPNVEIAEDNALTYDYARHGRVIVVGNLPYQISSPLLFRLLESRATIVRMVLMLQREVGDRIVAAPDTDAYGTLSLLVPMVCNVHRLCRVSAGAFIPAPRVESVVVVFEPLPQPRVMVRSLSQFTDVVHAAFAQRRKTLRNALRPLAETAQIEKALASCGIDEKRRGETLSLAEFAALTDALHA